FSGRFNYDRPPLPAEALHVNTSYLTAVANDYGYNYIFSRLIEAQASKGDILIGLSTSGKSSNVLFAMKTAKEKGLITIAMLGAFAELFEPHSDIILSIPFNDTPRIQEAHMLIGHIICELVEKSLFPKFA
ncbi:MAG: SIS domain-containing protein, partial [Bacteroidales bacterium]|nr:SIS domain-containing protein [Bacteroidales bacterium]